MEKTNPLVFEEYEDLYKLTSKTADAHIEFYKNKEFLSYDELFTTWKRLSQQAEHFSDRDWTENWHNWEKNYHAFEKHQVEARFLIQDYLTDVLEEMIRRLIRTCEEYTKLATKEEESTQISNKEISDLIKKEVKRIVKQELKSQMQRKNKK